VLIYYHLLQFILDILDFQTESHGNPADHGWREPAVYPLTEFLKIIGYLHSARLYFPITKRGASMIEWLMQSAMGRVLSAFFLHVFHD